MTDKEIIKEVSQEITDKKLEERKNYVRAYKQEQLELQEKWKMEKEKAEETLRIIKLNLENLEKGNFVAIDERIRKSEQARGLSILWKGSCQNTSGTWNPEWTNGTYIIQTPFGNKTFYF
jgi:hypothetical protein